MGFAEDLLTWYRRERRDLPWRRTRDPYAIWVSEAMLQQTTVTAVIPYWERWMARFPTLDVLARASLDDVLAQWQGLGYYRRARVLHEGARALSEQQLPTDAVGWRRLNGVGPYTAAAIASIAFDDPAPLVDGNVERVYARLTADDGSGSARHRRAWAWAEANLDRQSPGDWNQALMELGATICRPISPACLVCPVSTHCRAYAEGRQEVIPVRPVRPEITPLHWWAVVTVGEDGRVGLERVGEGEWWAGMWRVPTASEPPASGEAMGSVRATVTRYRIEISVFRASGPGPELTWFAPEELAELAIPAPYRRVLKIAGF